MPFVQCPLENESREKEGRRRRRKRKTERRKKEEEDEGKGCFRLLRDFVSFLRLFVEGVTTGKGVHFHNRAHAIRRFNLRRILARVRRVSGVNASQKGEKGRSE